MKKLLNILFLLLFSSFSSGLMAQLEENGWRIAPFSDVDTFLTKTYFSYTGTQIFENYGRTHVGGSGGEKNYSGFSWFKYFEPAISFPDTLLLKIRVLEEEGNLREKDVVFRFYDVAGGFYGPGGLFSLDYSWKIIKFPIREKMERVGMPIPEKVWIWVLYFQVESSDSASNVKLTVEADYLSGIYPDGSEVIYDDFGDIVSIPEEKLTDDFMLYQNYPNPFNPTTTISYSVPSTAHVTLDVYNILGQKVASLLNEEKVAGSYEVEFNASNLPSGTYFYRFQSGQFVQTKKMTLVK